METNELVKRYQAAEQELLKILEAVEGIEEGNLKELEETIYRGIFEVGRKLMEGRMNKEKEPESAKKSQDDLFCRVRDLFHALPGDRGWRLAAFL